MKRFVTYEPTLGEAALMILSEAAEATLKTFYPHPYYHAFCRHAHRRSFHNALKRLERKNLVGIKTKKGLDKWHLTSEGEKLVSILKMKMRHAGERKWDKKWRLVIFDVPEKIRGRRDYLRRSLHSFGFYQLQKSVWATPDLLPSEFIEFMSEMNLGNNFRVVTADSIQDDKDIKSFFFP